MLIKIYIYTQYRYQDKQAATEESQREERNKHINRAILERELALIKCEAC